jgi:hypothetical protein
VTNPTPLASEQTTGVHKCKKDSYRGRGRDELVGIHGHRKEVQRLQGNREQKQEIAVSETYALARNTMSTQLRTPTGQQNTTPATTQALSTKTRSTQPHGRTVHLLRLHGDDLEHIQDLAIERCHHEFPGLRVGPVPAAAGGHPEHAAARCSQLSQCLLRSKTQRAL